MVRFLTAGESHGQGLIAIIEGLPSGIKIDSKLINRELAKRQGGYGRGGRMKIEKDQAELLTGVRNGYSTGAPITLLIKNKDWENWAEIMQPEPGAKIEEKVVTHARPGHADLAGAIKYNQQDIRNILERASARETAIKVAVGALAQQLLLQFGITFWGHVVSIADVEAQVDYKKLTEALYQTDLYCTDEKATEEMKATIDRAKEQGDSLGGVVEVVVKDLPIGLGSHVHWDRKLDGRLAMALMSIPAIKGVEIGLGFESCRLPGSKVHDEIFYNEENRFYHKTNGCGGLEGGMTNGEDLILRAAMKPIPTLYQPLQSVDINSKEVHIASIERSDTCAVSAAAIVAESMVAWVILESFLEKFGGDHIDEVKRNYQQYSEYLEKR